MDNADRDVGTCTDGSAEDLPLLSHTDLMMDDPMDDSHVVETNLADSSSAGGRNNGPLDSSDGLLANEEQVAQDNQAYSLSTQGQNDTKPAHFDGLSTDLPVDNHDDARANQAINLPTGSRITAVFDSADNLPANDQRGSKKCATENLPVQSRNQAESECADDLLANDQRGAQKHQVASLPTKGQSSAEIGSPANAKSGTQRRNDCQVQPIDPILITSERRKRHNGMCGKKLFSFSAFSLHQAFY